MAEKKIRMGMVGGGKDAFIGAVHRIAANMDGLIELCCGAFSSNPEKAKASGRALFIEDNRNYGSYAEMFEVESQLPADQRMQFVSIVTPNFTTTAICLFILLYFLNFSNVIILIYGRN